MNLSPDEQVNALVKLGVPRGKALRQVNGPIAAPANVEWPTVQLPLTITLPWSHLVSDNARYGAVINGGKPRLLLTDRYKQARASIKSRLRAELGDVGPVNRPVALHAKVWTPDNRIHDVPDFAKGVHDALARQVYTNDALIYRATWERVGVDVDRPRAEITLTELEPNV